MKFKTLTGIAFAAAAIATPAAAASSNTCLDSPFSSSITADAEGWAEAQQHNVFVQDPEGKAIKGVYEKLGAAQSQRELRRHALDVITSFLARVKDRDWTPQEVEEAAGVLRDLGRDVWQVRSFVGDGKGGKRSRDFRNEATKAMLSTESVPVSVDDAGRGIFDAPALSDDAWAKFIRIALDQRVRLAEDAASAASGYVKGLQARQITQVAPVGGYGDYEINLSRFKYLRAAEAMVDELNLPATAAKRGLVGPSAWYDQKQQSEQDFVGDRATATELTVQGAKIFDAIPMGALFFHPNGRLCRKVSPTHSVWETQYWHGAAGSASVEIYRGGDGHFYSVRDNRRIDDK